MGMEITHQAAIMLNTGSMINAQRNVRCTETQGFY